MYEAPESLERRSFEKTVIESISEGLAERKLDRDKKASEEEAAREERKAEKAKSETIVEIEAQEDEELLKKQAKARAAGKVKDTDTNKPVEEAPKVKKTVSKKK